MLKKAGNNLNPKIINIDNLFDNKTNLKETNYELGRKGINKYLFFNINYLKPL